MKALKFCLSLILFSLFLVGCTSAPKVVNAPGIPTTYQDPSSPGILQGTGIESQDIKSMVDKMVRHMLLNPYLNNLATPPRVIVDSAHFKNESSQRINKNLLTDQLATQLQIAANGRILFIDRENAAMIEAERERKRNQTSDIGTTGLAPTQAGADYRLSGRIASIDARRNGVIERYMNIVFRMTNLETGLVVWTNQYDFKKAGQDDIIYR